MNIKTYSIKRMLLPQNRTIGKVIDANCYIDDCGKKYCIDGKKVVLDYNYKELEVAIWLAMMFGGDIYMLPRVNVPEGVKTADYLWNNERWDLKTVKSINENAIDYLVKKQKQQSRNFIIDARQSLLNAKEICSQVIKIYNSKSRQWIEKMIIITNIDIFFF